MTPERWQQIERLYEAALARDSQERALFLKQNCSGDDELCREVESLLAQKSGAESFVFKPIEAAALLFADNQSGSLDGLTLGPYHDLTLIGRGGMGEIYCARDVRLDRKVAIKKLPGVFANNPERIARLSREAKLLASLNHPNIASIYEFEKSERDSYLVMELVPGPTLAERLKAGPLEFQEVVRIGVQIAEALEAAHEKGIVHRDLKPANIKVTPEGLVKVLDFGLAMPMVAHPEATDAGLTAVGAILGTPGYMSPEQAKGEDTDRRTDIWAFGCVLYEMLTGHAAFEGSTAAEIFAAVLKGKPDWGRLPLDTPENLRRLLRRCLQKDRKRRLQWIADAAIEMTEEQSEPAQHSHDAESAKAARIWRLVALASIATVIIGGVVIAARRLPRSPATPSVARMVIPLPPGELLPADARFPVMALSPDGSQLASVMRPPTAPGNTQLYVRRLDQLQFTPLPRTEGATNPFFSPDGKWIGFFSGGKLQKVSVSGGPPIMLCNTADVAGATWGSGDQIIFSAATRLYKVPASGGEATVLTAPEAGKGEADYNWPEFLPDGRAILFNIQRSGASADDAQIAIQTLDTGQRRVLVDGGSFPRYVPTGHLVYIRAGTLLAQTFDPVSGRIGGAPVALVEGIMYGAASSALGLGVAQFTFSNLGSLVYLPGSVVGLRSPDANLVWVDRKGKIEPLPVPSRAYSWPRLSPNGNRLAVLIAGTATQRTSGQSDVWIYDLVGETWRRLTSEGNDGWPLWTPDGKRVAFTSTKNGPQNMFWKLADGSGPEEQLTSSANQQQIPRSWSPDGLQLVFNDIDPVTSRDLWVLPLHGDRKPRPFLRTSADEVNGVVSPDGHWLAYVSNQSGRMEIYVQPFPEPGATHAISTEGGGEPVWAHNGRELFYINGNKMMVVDVTTQPAFEARKPRVLFEVMRYVHISATPNYDVSADDQRFLMVYGEQPQHLPEANVILNWFEELKRKVATTK